MTDNARCQTCRWLARDAGAEKGDCLIEPPHPKHGLPQVHIYDFCSKHQAFPQPEPAESGPIPAFIRASRKAEGKP